MKKYITTTVMAIVGVALFVSAPTVRAFDIFPSDCPDDCGVVKSSTPIEDQVRSLIYTSLMVLGGISVIMIIVGGIRMAVAQGDPGNIKSGRLTVLWSVVGLVVALLSFAIVKFIVGWDWPS